MALVSGAGLVFAQERAGKRFFPTTVVVDDPFVADELTFPSILHIRKPATSGTPRTLETDIGAEFSKRLTPTLGVSLEGVLIHQNPEGQATTTGFENLHVGLKHQFFTSADHEAILAAGLGWEVGGTGRKASGADSFDVVNPAFLWGKGFGDLPEGLELLKPLAVTGVLGVKLPTRSRTRDISDDGSRIQIERHPNSLQWGVVLEYSFPYLESFVKDVRLRAPFDRMIPVVELDAETFLDRGSSGKTTGTINPGFIWEGEFFKIGLEAVFPINGRTGKTVGVRGGLTFFLDRLFPKSLGRPLFGRP